MIRVRDLLAQRTALVNSFTARISEGVAGEGGMHDVSPWVWVLTAAEDCSFSEEVSFTPT